MTSSLASSTQMNSTKMQQTIIPTDFLVKTPAGMQRCHGISRTWHRYVIEIKTLTRKIVAGKKHKFLMGAGWMRASKLQPGMTLTLADGSDEVIFSVKKIKKPQWMYDLLDVEGGNMYILNGVYSHNCEFLSSDALLISSMRLAQLREKPPVCEDMGFQFWTDPKKLGGPGKTYLVGVDPATGSGSDFTSIQCFEFPSMEQVAELRLNQVNIPLIYSKIKWLLKMLTKPDMRKQRADVIWSFERNGVGEALVAMIQNDDSADGGVYLDTVELFSESTNNNGRLGVYTSGKSKLVCCMQLKNLIEKVSGGFQIHSKTLIFELKNFIAAGGSYQGKPGATDDAVMALLVVVKLLNRFSGYNDKAKELMYEQVSPDMDISNGDIDSFGDEAPPFLI